ncbi:hypothetical protein B0I37DRAFT_415681 [Chaetomium sp. MPI-CAGE-AT-0009]|nr:hypothetical protein B0I37DRAFT_415681 [Chaetomium sp. MPI-CAGE-AT-0009]
MALRYSSLVMMALATLMHGLTRLPGPIFNNADAIRPFDIACFMHSAWCIADAYVVLPCGCDRAAVAPTTVSRCPTASGNCFQCSTGWGIATITDSNCPPSATATPTAP